ncbi:MAG TPA: short-chain fatty acid transporter [Clostridia bacterium]|nr:short-chain fatty acid transporter [Clostridia bacterium]
MSSNEKVQQRGGFIGAVTNFAYKWIPDAFVIALVLTLVTFLLALAFTDHNLYALVGDWGKGFWALLEFSMQMALIVVTGYALATTPFVNRILVSIARSPKNATQVYLLGVVATFIAYYINWGFGLIFAGIFTRELAKQSHFQGIKVDYRLLVASAYATFMLWHVGLSGSVPLLVATPNHFMVKEMGVIPVTHTLFAFQTIVILIIVVLVTIFLFTKVYPPKPNEVITLAELHPEYLEKSFVIEEQKLEGDLTPAQRMTHSKLLAFIIGLAFLVYAYHHFFVLHKSIDINMVNFLMLMLIIFLHKTPARVIQAFKEGTPMAWGIILQFPFYAGIFGIMKYSGLAEVIAKWIMAITTPSTFPVFVCILSAILGYFVPSGGAKWAIEAPYIIAAGAQLGVPHAATVIAYAFGNDWINLIQPFWALPFLAVVGLEFREIMGYTAITFVVLGIFLLLGLYFVPLAI